MGNITDSLKHTSSVQVYEGITDLVVHAVDGQHHYSGVHVCTALLLWTLPMEALTQCWAVCVCCVAVEDRFLHSSVNCSLTCSFIAFPQPLPLTDTHFVSRTLCFLRGFVSVQFEMTPVQQILRLLPLPKFPESRDLWVHPLAEKGTVFLFMSRLFQ